MEEHIKRTLREFIEINWSAFIAFCDTLGVNLADEVYKKLGGELEGDDNG